MDYYAIDSSRELTFIYAIDSIIKFYLILVIDVQTSNLTGLKFTHPIQMGPKHTELWMDLKMNCRWTSQYFYMNQPGENQIEQCNRATTKQRATKPNHHNSKAPQATTAIKHNLTPQPNRRTKTGSSKRLRNHHIRSCARSRRKLSALSYSEIKIDRIVPKRSPPCTTRHKIQLLQ